MWTDDHEEVDYCNKQQPRRKTTQVDPGGLFLVG